VTPSFVFLLFLSSIFYSTHLQLAVESAIINAEISLNNQDFQPLEEKLKKERPK
jgi:hypothetical protein